MITKEEILNQLDKDAIDFVFPMLDNGYYYHGDQKMTIYGDKERWAILIQIFAFNNHEDTVAGFTTIANVYGNSLLAGNDNDNFNYFVDDVDTKTFLYDDESYLPYLNEKVSAIKIREETIPFDVSNDFLLKKGIIVEQPNRITPWELMRSLIPENSSKIWLTSEEISKKIPIDLPIILEINEWHHPDLADNGLPSNTETFNQIANVILTGNKELYKPTIEANTHLKNWPDGGTL